MHMKSTQHLYFIRIIQIKTISGYHHTIVGMAKIKETVNNKDKEQLEISDIAGGDAK